MNPFIESVTLAQRERLCVAPWCTTCGHDAYRRALAGLVRAGSGDLERALGEVQPDALTRERGWEDCLRSVFNRNHGLDDAARRRVLGAWLATLWSMASPDLRFADVVLYYLVRRRLGWPEARPWVETCVSLAVRSRDPSLIESLLYTLRGGVADYPDLCRVAVAAQDGRVVRAWSKVMGTSKV